MIILFYGNFLMVKFPKGKFLIQDVKIPNFSQSITRCDQWLVHFLN